MDNKQKPVSSQLLHAGMQVSLLRMKVNGNSMLPFLRDGDSVLVTHCEQASLKLGDVVIIRQENNFVTHRLVFVKDDQYILKGDHSLYLDPPVVFSDLIGVVVGRIHGSELVSYQTPKWKWINKVLGKVDYLEGSLVALIKRIIKRKS